ncbi:MAG: hypothetical protein BWY52_03277 [Chloroflexi bacterium ADurb.Bin325]|nr:MAG: hypothetical protein BWY52_03277 [Chloroflexi bacterium ADurb.Bin325]
MPAVAAVTTGRAVALSAWTPPAASRPHIIAKAGLISLMMLPLAAKRIAPATGRMTVLTMSLMLSTAGTLSATVSMTSRTASTPSTHGLSSAFQGALRVMTSV